jgi:hypothetical protein
VKQNIDQMISKWPSAPKPVFQPKHGMGQRIELLRGPRLNPNLSETRQAPQLRLGEMSIIVPDWRSVPGREEDHYSCNNQQEAKPPIMARGTSTQDVTLVSIESWLSEAEAAKPGAAFLLLRCFLFDLQLIILVNDALIFNILMVLPTEHSFERPVSTKIRGERQRVVC